MNRAAVALLAGFGLAAMSTACGTDDEAVTSPIESTPTNAEVTPTNASTTSDLPPFTWATTPPDSASSSICSNPPVRVAAVPSAFDDLLLVDDNGDVLRLDLASGAVVCDRPSGSTGPAPWVWGVPAGAIRLESGLLISTASFGGGSWYVPDDPAVPVELLYESFPVAVYWPTGAVHTVWMFEHQDEVRVLNPIDMQTEPAIPLPDGGRPVAADGGGELVILTGREYSTLSADGRSTSLWNGSYLVAVRPNALVGLVCQATDTCRLVVVDRNSGVERDLGPGPAAFARGDVAEWVAMSPAGTMLATPTLEGDLSSMTALDGPMVIELATGTVVELTGGVWPVSSRNLVWSTDGSYLYWVDGNGGLRAWSADDPDNVIQLGADVLPVLRVIAVDQAE
jgi:hypothetical protein